MSKKTSIEELIIQDLQKIQQKWLKEKKKGMLTRSFYRRNGKYSTAQIEKLFDSFTELKKHLDSPNDEKITRHSFDIFKSNSKNNKRYFVSSIIAGADINENFWDSIIAFCNHNKAEPLLLVMRGVNGDDEFSQDIIEKYKQYFVTEFEFNKNLIARDFMLNPQQILPLTGLQRYGGRQQSIIVAHSKQMLVTIPKQHSDFPHLVLSTGTICTPKYRNTRQGQIAKEDNCLGGVIIEVKNDKIFFLRLVKFDGVGFQDLSYYYMPNVASTKSVNSVIIEPHFGQEDKDALKLFDEIMKECNPKNIFIHDSIDAGSVNPYVENKIGLKCIRSNIQQSLENELFYLGKSLEEIESKYSALCYHVYSNHNLFIDRYLESGLFIKDPINVKIGAQLFLALIEGANPIEYYLNQNFNLKNQNFLKKGQSFQMYDCEMNVHGHKGSNGTRGNIKNIETSSSSAIVGHSHSPSIWRDVVSIPCMCKLIQEYNSDGSSNWLQGVGLLFENGQKQIILNIYGEWRL